MATSFLQLTEQENPLAQTFTVTEPGGSCITSIGLWFSSAPATGTVPVEVELRPVSEGGNPSGTRFYSGARAVQSAAVIRAAASTSFNSATEVKFTFREPVYIPGNTQVALVVSTGAPAGEYKIWVGTQGEFVDGSTTQLISHDLNSGALFKSSNGTTWTADQYTDIAFKVYRASFNHQHSQAALIAPTPPVKRLTENEFTNSVVRYPGNPLSFTAGSSDVSVIHPAHGFIVGDKVKLMTDSDGFDSSDTINGISGANILKTHTITAVDPYGYTVDVGANATASVRAGGTSLMANEQYAFNVVKLSVPYSAPPYTSVFAGGSFTTTTSFANNETAYSRTGNVRLPMREAVMLKDPHVIANSNQEADVSKLNGNPSAVVAVGLRTLSKYTAPVINVASADLHLRSNFVDYQDSASSSARNDITTIPYADETNASGGTNASKHITIPFNLAKTCDSIKVFVDATRPENTDFKVWYRTGRQSADLDISETPWTQFSTSPNVNLTYSNYDVLPRSKTFREYEFNSYDIPDFDVYQIKITFHSRRSSYYPVIQNLRTIATAQY